MKLIITESQLKIIGIFLNETHSHEVEKIVTYLKNNYEPTGKYVRKGGAYSEKPMVTIKVDGEVITLKDLLMVVKNEFKPLEKTKEGVSDDFIKQVIQDWMFNKVSDKFELSKNISH